MQKQAERKAMHSDKQLKLCESQQCETCQCHKQFSVVCKGHCYKSGRNSSSELMKNGFDRRKKDESSKVKSKYSTKFLRSLISLRIWVLAPDVKLSCR